jgi:hypothetical protein
LSLTSVANKNGSKSLLFLAIYRDPYTHQGL